MVIKTLFWPWSEKTLLWASPWCNINRQVLSPSRHQEYKGFDGENPKRLIKMFETSKSGSHQSIEVALDYFMVFRSTVDGIKVLWRSWNRRVSILWALEKTNMLQGSQNYVNVHLTDKSSSGGFKSPWKVIQELPGWKASENLQRQRPLVLSSNYHGSTVWLGTAWTNSTKFVHQIVTSQHVFPYELT